MRIFVNGIPTEAPDNFSVTDLVRGQGLCIDRVAVELNESVRARESWETTGLRPGDRVELVHFVGGG